MRKLQWTIKIDAYNNDKMIIIIVLYYDIYIYDLTMLEYYCNNKNNILIIITNIINILIVIKA